MELNITQLEWLAKHQNNVKYELEIVYKHEEEPVDVLMVVHNGLKFLKPSIESIQSNTNHCSLFIYDNSSDQITKDWLDSLQNVKFKYFSDKNDGFIKPNNFLIDKGNSPYVILLNSDTVVMNSLWARALTSMLKEFPDLGVVGYQGGVLDETCKGVDFRYGREIDYVEGWCLCISRHHYEKFGLFDEKNLQFAYGEDADLALRLRENGLYPYALHLGTVLHHGNLTAKQVAREEGHARLTASFNSNHDYLKSRWSNYVRENRLWNPV